jgi:hypothetical protein
MAPARLRPREVEVAERVPSALAAGEEGVAVRDELHHGSRLAVLHQRLPEEGAFAGLGRGHDSAPEGRAPDMVRGGALLVVFRLGNAEDHLPER